MPVLVRPVRVDDYVEILRINSEASPHVAKLDECELDRLVTLARVAWVADSTTGVCGYLLAMSNTDDYDGEEFRSFRQRLTEPFMYVDQIAIDFDARRTNVASQMYERLMRWSHEHSRFVLCCEVNVQPPNSASMKFHERLGFESLGEMRTCDGRLVALLCKHVPRPNRTMEPTR
jgi:predicted GNAT superfamily acetyltransferase